MVSAAPDAEIAAIMEDKSLSFVERMRRRQDLMNTRFLAAQHEEGKPEDKASEKDLEYLKCGICLELCTRPVSTSCQHNFCLKCFKKHVNHGKTDCPTCRTKIHKDLLQNPRVNTMLTSRLRKVHAPAVTVHVTHHKDSERPDEAFTTENAKRKGLSNACSGRIRVTCPLHHFGPIGPEYDPERGLGVCVGDTWTSRLHCRQWGAHVPHVAGIAGQSRVGAQSIVLSGGFEDDRDEGEWLLYTGSGGKDLSGNKRTNKVQSADQVFEGGNQALVQSCIDGLPVRVLRSNKEKNSSYAPQKGDPSQSVRYDGVYKIVAAWRAAGQQGKLVCRYLMRRCDNSPAPWDSGTAGDGEWLQALPAHATQEMEGGQDIHLPQGQPYWDFDVGRQLWQWARSPAVGKDKATPHRKPSAQQEVTSILRSLAKCYCTLCKHVMMVPVFTPCGHQFCKACLEAKYAAEAPSDCAARPLRTRKQRKPCPVCNKELADFMDGPTFQVNQAMQEQIAGLQTQLHAVQEKMRTEEHHGDEGSSQECSEESDEESDSDDYHMHGTAPAVEYLFANSAEVIAVQPSRVKYSCAPHWPVAVGSVTVAAPDIATSDVAALGSHAHGAVDSSGSALRRCAWEEALDFSPRKRAKLELCT